MKRVVTSAVAILALATPAFGQHAGLELLRASQKASKKASQSGTQKASPDEKKQVAEAAKKLQRKWIVLQVQRDGKPNAAQIGQKLGDVITIRQGSAGIAFG